MKQTHIALVVKEENNHTITTVGPNTEQSASWVISRARLGYLKTISIHRDHAANSFKQGTIVGFDIHPVTGRITIKFQAHDQTVAGKDLNWAQEKAYSF